jgi:transposase
MSLKPEPLPPVPEETARVARATFPRGNVVMHMRDALGTIYTDEVFSDLFPMRGQPAEAPWRLALVTVLQFMENLTDRQAAEAVRRCLDWKYALSLDLTDQGFHHTVLSEFRTRLVTHGAEERLFDALLDLCKARGWLKAGGRQRTDSTHVLAAVRRLNRLECVGEAMVHVLNVLAQVAPEWVGVHARPAWVERYAHRVEDYRLPKGKEERLRYAEEIGADGWELLALVEAPDAPAWLRDLPAVQSVRRIWSQQYYEQAGGGHWRTDDDLPPAKEVQNSPYDVEARFAQKRQTCWVGYTRPFDRSL